VELAEAATESLGGDEPEPALADEGSADEACRVIRWEPEEDLLDELVHQRRRHHAWIGLVVARVS
jgi:hypothetical protein